MYFYAIQIKKILIFIFIQKTTKELLSLFHKKIGIKPI